MTVTLDTKELEEAVIDWLKKRGALLTDTKYKFVLTNKGMTVELDGISFPTKEGPYR